LQYNYFYHRLVRIAQRKISVLGLRLRDQTSATKLRYLRSSAFHWEPKKAIWPGNIQKPVNALAGSRRIGVTTFLMYTERALSCHIRDRFMLIHLACPI